VLESQTEDRGEVWLCTLNPSDFLCFGAPSKWDCWFSLVPVQLPQSPSPAAGGSSRGEPKRLRFGLGVSAGPRGAAPQLSKHGLHLGGQPGLGRAWSGSWGFIAGLSKGCSEQFLRKPVTGKLGVFLTAWTGLSLAWEFVSRSCRILALWYHFVSVLLSFAVIL